MHAQLEAYKIMPEGELFRLEKVSRGNPRGGSARPTFAQGAVSAVCGDLGAGLQRYHGGWSDAVSELC